MHHLANALVSFPLVLSMLVFWFAICSPGSICVDWSLYVSSFIPSSLSTPSSTKLSDSICCGQLTYKGQQCFIVQLPDQHQQQIENQEIETCQLPNLLIFSPHRAKEKLVYDKLLSSFEVQIQSYIKFAQSNAAVMLIFSFVFFCCFFFVASKL